MASYSIDGGLLASQVACFVGSSSPEHSPCTALSHGCTQSSIDHHVCCRLSGWVKSSMTMTEGPQACQVACL